MNCLFEMSRLGRVFLKGHRKTRDEEDEELVFNLQLEEFNDSISETLRSECSWVRAVLP